MPPAHPTQVGLFMVEAIAFPAPSPLSMKVVVAIEPAGLGHTEVPIVAAVQSGDPLPSNPAVVEVVRFMNPTLFITPPTWSSAVSRVISCALRTKGPVDSSSIKMPTVPSS